MVDIKVDKQQPLKIDSYFNYFNVALFIYSKNLILYTFAIIEHYRLFLFKDEKYKICIIPGCTAT